MLPAADLTEVCSCNNCGHNDSRRLYTEIYRLGQIEVELGIGQCSQCGLVYVSPRLSLEALRYVYGEDAGATISHNYCWNSSGDGFRFRGILKKLKRIQPEGRLLDVGCGAGQFLAEAKRTGHWTVVGLEPNSRAAAQARLAGGCTVHNTTLDGMPSEPCSFDVVTMFGVLEHLHDPRGVLRSVHCLLKPGGVVAVYVPNFHYLRLKDTGFFARFRTGRWSNLHPQEHQFQFTPQSICTMLENSGFQCLRIDIGRPFLRGGPVQKVTKLFGYGVARCVKVVSGVHLGGIEILAQRIGNQDIFPTHLCSAG